MDVKISHIENKKVLDFGNEYNSQVIILFGKQRELSNGKCPDCRAKLLKAEEEKENFTRLQQIAQKRRIWRETTIFPKYINSDFSNFERLTQNGNVAKVYKQCWDYANNFPIEYEAYLSKYKKSYPSLMLMSPKNWGVGKTHLVCAIAHKILDRWQGGTSMCPIAIVSEPEILSKIQETFSYNDEERRMRESEQDIINGLIYKPLLILDDIAKEKRHDPRFVQRILFALVNGRYNKMRPMVMTTNADLTGLMNYISGNDGDEAIMSRLTEMCVGGFTEVIGKDYRVSSKK